LPMGMSRCCASRAVGWNHGQDLKSIGNAPHTVNQPGHVNRGTQRMTVMYHDDLALHPAHVQLHQ
ncbi:MAG TPA: hypothetical protein VFI05_02945, partial [Nitrospiraceae bacterium]|nr:hypothetical protein [Nitrospiraceae bacterium]